MTKRASPAMLESIALDARETCAAEPIEWIEWIEVTEPIECPRCAPEAAEPTD
jgi:hypothetical protein